MSSSSEVEKGLKKLVLEEQMDFLCEELGDPKRYFPYLRSKGTLDNLDCQSIRAQTTFKEQVEQMISLLKGRQSYKGEHAFDVLVEALKQQRVQAHIARSLQRALAKAKAEVILTHGSHLGRLSVGFSMIINSSMYCFLKPQVMIPQVIVSCLKKNLRNCLHCLTLH